MQSYQLLSGAAVMLFAGLGVACHLLRHRVRNADLMRTASLVAALVLAVVASIAGEGAGQGPSAAHHDAVDASSRSPDRSPTEPDASAHGHQQ